VFACPSLSVRLFNTWATFATATALTARIRNAGNQALDGVATLYAYQCLLGKTVKGKDKKE